MGSIRSKEMRATAGRGCARIRLRTGFNPYIRGATLKVAREGSRIFEEEMAE